MMQERIALVIVAVFLALAGMSALLPEIRFMSTKLRYNDAEPIVYHVFKWQDTEAVRGGQIRYHATYSKRVGCHPPRGRGWISYRFARLEGGKATGLTYTVNAVRDANWPAGDSLPGSANAPVPHNLQPGRYTVWGEAVFECAGASQPLKVPTPAHIITIT